MNSKWWVVLATAALMTANPGWSASDKGKGGGQGKAKTSNAGQVEDTYQPPSQKAETLHHHESAVSGQDTQERDGDKERNGDEGRDKNRDKDRDKDRDGDGDDDSDRDRQASRGNETAQEMQRRKDERREIKGDYKEARQAGAVEASGKKPWWKFWEGDNAEATPTEN